MKMGRMTERTGLPASTIRYYESTGLLPKPLRRGGKRDFDEEAMTILKVIQIAQAMGFRINEIKTLTQGISMQAPMPQRWKAFARKKVEEIDLLLENCRRMKILLDQAIRCDCLTISDCLAVLRPTRRR